MADPAVARYYDAIATDEWRRLGGDGRVEWELGTRLLARTLVPGCSVVDIGSGPGRWSVWLAENGWRTSAFDVSARSLLLLRKWARHRGARLERVEVADATSLPRDLTGSFDAALVFGPYYHAQDPSDRASILREAKRVVRPCGYVFLAYMPPYFRSIPLLVSNNLYAFERGKHALAAGFIRSEGAFPGVALTPSATVKSEIDAVGLAFQYAIASQSFLAHQLESCGAIDEANSERFDHLMELAFQHASNPAIHDAAAQVIAVAYVPPTGREHDEDSR